MRATASVLMTCPRRVVDNPPRVRAYFKSPFVWRVAGARANGMTLFEILVALALLIAVMSITIPMVASQTNRIAFEEVTATLERQAAIVRSDAQRETEAVWFEARQLPDGIWAIGVSRMNQDEVDNPSEMADWTDVLIGDLESVLPEDPDSMERSVPVDRNETFSSFEVLRRLPTGYSIRRTLPDEIVALGEEPMLDEHDPFAEEAFELALDEAAQEMPSPFGETPPGLIEEIRIVLAVFLPDGTLIGPEQLYLFAPDERIATIRFNRWLGSVKCAPLVRADLTPEDKSEPDRGDTGDGDEDADRSRGPNSESPSPDGSRP